MIRKVVFIVAVVILVGLTGYIAKAGGTGAGNGGDVIVCPSGKAEVLDVFELRINKGMLPALDSGDYKAKVFGVLAKLKRFSPLREKQYQVRLLEIYKNLVWTKTELIDVPDSFHAIMPTGCRLRQIAIQERIGNNEIKLTINENLWSQLDEDNRAALLLHELAYAEAIDRKATNSIAARNFNGVLINMPDDIDKFCMRFNYIGIPEEQRGFPAEAAFASGDIVLMLESTSSVYFSRSSNSACGVFLSGNSSSSARLFDFCNVRDFNWRIGFEVKLDSQFRVISFDGRSREYWQPLTN